MVAMGGGKGNFQFLPGVGSASDLPAPDLEAAPDLEQASLSQEAGAFGAGVIRPFGGDRALKFAGVKPETLEHLKKVAPGWSATGHFLGAAAPSLIAGALTAGAAAPAVIGAQAAAGGATALGEAISEDALGESQLVSERTLAHVGLGTLIGGATQGVFEGLSAGIPKAINAFRASTIDAENAVHQAVVTGAAHAGEKATGFGLKDYFKDPAAATSEERLAQENAGDVLTKDALQLNREKATGALYKSISALTDKQDEANSIFETGHRAQMRSVMDPSDATANAAVDKSASLLSQLRSMSQEMRADPKTYKAGNIQDAFENVLDKFEGDLGKIDPRTDNAAADLHEAIGKFGDNFKKSIPFEDIEAQERDAPIGTRVVAEKMHDAYSMIRGASGDEGTFGKSAKLFNETAAIREDRFQAEHNDDKTGFLDFFGKGTGKSRAPDLGKVNTYLGQWAKGKATSEAPMQSIETWLGTMRKYGDYVHGRFEAGGMHPIDDLGSAVSEVEKAMATAKDATDAAINYVKPKPGIAQSFQRYARGVKGEAEEGSMLGAGAEGLEAVNRGAEAAEHGAGMLGQAAGALGLGHLAPVALAGLAAVKVARAAPAAAIKVLGAIARRNNFVNQAIRTSARDMVEGTSESAGTSELAAAGDKGLRSVDFAGGEAPAGETRAEGAKRLSDQLSDLQASPSALPDRLTAAMRHVREHAPGVARGMTASTLQAALFLASKAPRDPLAGQTVAPDDWTPTPDQARDFEQYVQGAVYPMRTVHRMTKGLATPHEVEAFNTVWPAMAADHKGAITARLVKNPEKIKAMTHQRKVILSAYLGRPVDRTTLPLTPPPVTMPAPAPQPNMRAKPLRSKLSIADRSQLSTERGSD